MRLVRGVRNEIPQGGDHVFTAGGHFIEGLTEGGEFFRGVDHSHADRSPFAIRPVTAVSARTGAAISDRETSPR